MCNGTCSMKTHTHTEYEHLTHTENISLTPGGLLLPRGCLKSSVELPLPGGFGLWADLPSPKRAIWAPGLPLWGSRARRTSHTQQPRRCCAGHTPPSAVVLVRNHRVMRVSRQRAVRYLDVVLLVISRVPPPPHPARQRRAGTRYRNRSCCSRVCMTALFHNRTWSQMANVFNGRDTIRCQADTWAVAVRIRGGSESVDNRCGNSRTCGLGRARNVTLGPKWRKGAGACAWVTCLRTPCAKPEGGR